MLDLGYLTTPMTVVRLRIINPVGLAERPQALSHGLIETSGCNFDGLDRRGQPGIACEDLTAAARLPKVR
jgi:hypothetical protein